jgi:molybdate transport system regulatory protein
VSTPQPKSPPRLRTRLRLKADDKLILGPGRLQILRGVEETGSIAAAARTMGMSYRRAWLLIDDINHCFQQPLVESVSGGKRGGGAQVTELGKQVMALYSDLLATTEAAIATHKDQLSALLAEPLPPS